MIVTWHISHLDMLFQLMEKLLMADHWFDVRVIVIAEKWSITFNDTFPVPKNLVRFLEKPEHSHHPSMHEPLPPRSKDPVAAVKAQRRKERKGTRR